MTNNENLVCNKIEEIKNSKLPVIIYGAGIVGEVILKACQQTGIRVECFCDNNLNKTGQDKCRVPVVHTPTLPEKFPDAHILIAAADIQDVVRQLNSMGYDKWHDSSLLLRDFDIYQHEYTAPMDFVEYAVESGLLCHYGYMQPDKLFLRSVDIIITERCSLKCRDCSNLMQYYVGPVDFPPENIIEQLDRFMEIVDEVNEFRVIGGEPFMNKDFDKVIERLNAEPKVKKIVIYTNGTIAPKQEKLECLKNKKVLVLITDYGDLSRNLNNLSELCSQNNIAYYAQKAHGWTNCSKITKHERTNEQQMKLFNDCCAKNTFTISDGKFYRCPFAANADRLRAVPQFEEDNLDFIELLKSGTAVKDIKHSFKKYLFEKEFLETCDFCNGRSFGDTEITPAIQAQKPLNYERFEL